MQKLNNKVSNIILGTGDGGNTWGFFGPSYKKLAPKLDTYKNYSLKYNELVKLKDDTLKLKEYLKLREMIENEYIKSYYETRLKNLDVDILVALLEKKLGKNIILLCHENTDEFCHRRLLADYIELKTGIYIPEVSIDCEGIIKRINPIRYKDKLIKIERS